MSNTATATATPAATLTTQEMEERLNGLLREAMKATDAARQSRLWASPAYVAEAHSHADKAWETYWLVKEPDCEYWIELLR